MGESKFFTNEIDNTLYDKFRGILAEMQGLHSFHAVVGFFRSSGYFALREQLSGLDKVQILVGINIDDIFRQHNKSMMFLPGEKVEIQAREQHEKDFIEDMKYAGYYERIEQGVNLLIDDLRTGKLEMKLHATKDLHAKFYLFLPEKHTRHSDGWVIMGSSNLSEQGLGLTRPPRYELNVAMKDFDDVAFCKAEFDRLWEEGLPITEADIERYKSKTHLGQQPTPYEIYMKLLIDYFGDQIEDDFSLDVPESFMDLKYQRDAVSQGYQMMKKYGGFFLADVVGLGKTVVGTMVARRFIEENGIHGSRILVVHPPRLFDNWSTTFEKFGIRRYADFISCGNLEKIFEDGGEYLPLEEYDLIIVDEAHRFRGDTSNMYDNLQRICKTERVRYGRVGGRNKLVMLVSATPLNISPKDLYNLLLLFQDKHKSNIDGIPNLQNYFAPRIARYKKLMGADAVDMIGVNNLYEEIRKGVIDKVTVRRTRENIKNYKEYQEDLDKQGVVFPKIERPRELIYFLPDKLKDLFNASMDVLTEKLKYARYKAIENLTPEFGKRYANAHQISTTLAGIYRVHMVKRLESSFEAFRISLNNLRRNTLGMVKMWEEDKIIIAHDLKIKDLLDKGFELDEIIEKGIEKFGLSKEEFVYSRSAFYPTFIDDLRLDIAMLDDLIGEWEKVDNDPKLDKFIEELSGRIFDKNENPTGKVVIFSESKDTINYLERELRARLGRADILTASSESKKKSMNTILANFKPGGCDGKTKDDYNILISTDMLSEGVDLHRSNVIVHYDSPWNPIRLIQRNGRVNRIGSVADSIYNYLFYPSAEGDAEIHLYKNLLVKLQGFHAAYGEDSQVFSREEILGTFELFNPKIGDDVDLILQYLDEVRSFRKRHPEEFERIKNLPVKSRTGRRLPASGKNSALDTLKPETALVYIASPYKQEFYKVEQNLIKTVQLTPDQAADPHYKNKQPPQEKYSVEPLGFLDAAALFKADPQEESMVIPDSHYQSVCAAHARFDKDITDLLDKGSGTSVEQDTNTLKAKKFLRWIWRDGKHLATKENCDILRRYVEQGTYSRLSRELTRLETRYRNGKADLEAVEVAVRDLVIRYHKGRQRTGFEEDPNSLIIVSEYFI